jgi:hypothetical protein
MRAIMPRLIQTRIGALAPQIDRGTSAHVSISGHGATRRDA